MFNKIEFSDLYKFLTSAGLFIMAAALIIPWLFVKQNNGLLITEVEFQNLIESSKEIAQQRIVLSSWIFNLIKPFSIGLFTIGALSFCFGLYKWWIKQKNIDKIDIYNLLEQEIRIKQLTQSEIEEKARKEVKEELRIEISDKETDSIAQLESSGETTTTTTTTTTTVDEMKSKLLNTEELIFKKIVTYNSFYYKPKSNVDIGENFHLDILLESYEIRKRVDILIDIKYLQSSLNMEFIREGYSHFMKTRAYYFNKFKRNVKTIFIVIYNNRIADDEQIDRFIKAFSEFKTDRNSSTNNLILIDDKDMSTFDPIILFK